MCGLSTLLSRGEGLAAQPRVLAVGSRWVRSMLGGTLNDEGCGQGTGSVCCRDRGKQPPPPPSHTHTHTPSMGKSASPESFTLCFQRLPGEQEPGRQAGAGLRGGRLSPPLVPIPCPQLPEPWGHVASLCAPRPAPPSGLRASGWAGGWSIIRANVISGRRHFHLPWHLVTQAMGTRRWLVLSVQLWPSPHGRRDPDTQRLD